VNKKQRMKVEKVGRRKRRRTDEKEDIYTIAKTIRKVDSDSQL